MADGTITPNLGNLANSIPCAEASTDRLAQGTISREAAAYGIPFKAVTAFYGQARSAKRRGILFLFTLTEWWEWWQVDGRWDRRGRTKGAFVMARHGDQGPYSPENVYCATQQQNHQDADPIKHREACKLGIQKAVAQGMVLGAHLRIRGDGHPKSKAIITPMGRFGSAALAADAYGIHPNSATKKARQNWNGWRYEVS